MEVELRASSDTFETLAPDEMDGVVAWAVGQVEREYRRNGWGFDQAMAHRCGATVAKAVQTALRVKNSPETDSSGDR